MYIQIPNIGYRDFELSVWDNVVSLLCYCSALFWSEKNQISWLSKCLKHRLKIIMQTVHLSVKNITDGSTAFNVTGYQWRLDIIICSNSLESLYLETIISWMLINGERWANAESKRKENLTYSERWTHGERYVNVMFTQDKRFIRSA